MDVAILADIISDIIQNTNCLATRLSEGDKKQFENQLREILEEVENAKHIHSQSSDLVTWVQSVKEVVNDVDDLMEDLRHKDLMEDLHHKESAISTTWLMKATQNVAHHLKVTPQPIMKAGEKLTLLATKAKNLSSSQEEKKNKESNMITPGEEFDETSEAIGRENEKKQIIDQLSKSSESASVVVVSIVGATGIGKTKLARVVCGDEKVRSGFDSQIWLHGILDVESIVKRVTESVSNEKRFLLVLDDLRVEIDEGWLEKLKQKLIEARPHCGAILITTRKGKIASNYDLDGLKENESWSLFQQIRGQVSYSSNEEQDNEKKMVKEIVKDCGGVPLAIITLARLLKSRGSPVAEPEVEALKDFVQKQHYYYQLPTHQKLCFAYFALFPRDSLIDAEFLIRLWMVEGFLARNISSNDYQQQEQSRQEFLKQYYEQQEQRGREFLKQFDHVFFENVEIDERGIVRSCKMKPLMHDLARIVAKDENISMDSGVKKFDSGILRASFDFDLDVSRGIPDLLFEIGKKLRTILLLAKTNKTRLPHEVKMTASTCGKLFNSFKNLRLLDLHDLGISTVPSSVGEMKHLRYLDMSYNNMKNLPSCITQLSYLQTLKLSHCHALQELPKDLGDLSDLVHLDIQGCFGLTQMPHGISKLTSLLTLSLFAASNYAMEELKDLNNIRGKLEIVHLEQMKCPSTSSENGFLNNKQYLQQLTLRWEHDDDDEEEEKKKGNERRSKKDDKDEDERSLDCLVPHENLRALDVEGYNGQQFSNWLSSIKGLVKLCLTDCPRCHVLPSLDKLPNLRVLELWRLESLEFIAKKSDNPAISINAAPFLTSLEELTISDCPKLIGWWENEKWVNEKGEEDTNIPLFTSISKLHIQCCPKLNYMPLYPYLDENLVMVDSSVVSMQLTIHAKTYKPFSRLKSMLIERIPKSPPQRWIENFTSLKNLQVRDCPQLEILPPGFGQMKSLKNLTIEKCPKLNLDRSSTEWEGLKELHSLTLGEIPLLESLPKGIEHVTSLKHLELYRCYGLTSLQESMSHLTSLERLVISKCSRLASLPKGMVKLKSLHTLKIMDCPLLTPRCQPETGDDWPQIRRINKILVKQTSQDLRKYFYF